MNTLTIPIVSPFGLGNIQALSTVKNFSDEQLAPYDEIAFDFAKFKETNPFNILLIANAMNNCHDRFNDRKNLDL